MTMLVSASSFSAIEFNAGAVVMAADGEMLVEGEVFAPKFSLAGAGVVGSASVGEEVNVIDTSSFSEIRLGGPEKIDSIVRHSREMNSL
jgi:hypothetical protein